MKFFVRYIIVSMLIMVGMTGCQDDYIKRDLSGDGMAEIQAELDFKPMYSALAKTRAAGDTLNDISALHVLLYDYNSKTLIKSWKLEESTKSNAGYTVSDEIRNPTDAENGLSAERTTKRATFKLPDGIYYGRYYMYAVANIPDLLDNTTYAEAIETLEGLKSLPLTWNSENIAANGQMIGCFTNGTEANGADSDGSVLLSKKNENLHAWLRRAASKVTVAFDGSNLKEGVFIYLQSVQIKDIPSQCYLGRDNNVGKDGYTLAVPASGAEMIDGEIIRYHEEDASDKFEFGDDCVKHRVTVGSPHFGSHDETAPALYFYENMQGKGIDKRQVRNEDGTVKQNPVKDDMPYGTYIEVKAHYISNNSERFGNGPIIYRFMLGQDVLDNYDARRNCHYKLTLKFNKFANDADWHIEYEEPRPGVMAPEPYYISYLYNHGMTYPIKVSTGGHKIESIKAEIIENCWAPYNANANDYYTPADKGTTEPWNGFLSLHKTTKTVLNEQEIGSNKDYYYKVPKRGEREYKNFTLAEGEMFHDFTTDQSEPDDTYRVEKHPTDPFTYNIYLPMYTRAKQMIVTTGYTGNNPYVAYQRKAVVKITTKLEGLDDYFYNEVPIYQVRRVVNPKGIYRSFGNNKSFRVVLKRLPGEDERMFKSFQSDGPWKAYVVKRYNGDGITLSVTSDKSEIKSDSQYGQVIYGKTGSEIDFSVDFSGTASENRYAIIRVEYHNYTCQHLIFVRQGDKPDDLVPGGTKWYAQNMRTSSDLASNPLDEGSLFKFGNWNNPIDAKDNKNPFEPWINVTYTSFKAPDSLTNAETKKKMKWENITYSGSSATFGKPKMANARVATHNDFWEFRKNDDYIEQGYGVLYGDDATQTADDIVDVYGYDYEHNTQGRGMRGCFVYNSQTGKNLFFPIGASGYGHRKQSFTPAQSWQDGETLNGVLRYAAGRTKLYPSPDTRPLFYDIYKRPGAIYWFNAEVAKGWVPQLEGNALGWDINYFSFDFNFIDTGLLIRKEGSDACFVRCVVDP